MGKFSVLCERLSERGKAKIEETVKRKSAIFLFQRDILTYSSLPSIFSSPHSDFSLLFLLFLYTFLLPIILFLFFTKRGAGFMQERGISMRALSA